MRDRIACSLIIAAAATAGGFAAGDASAQPARRPGLWEMDVSTMGRDMHMQMCVGVEKPGDAQAFAQGGPRGRMGGAGDCARAPSVTPTPGGMSFHMVCHPSPEMTMDSTGVVSGDFRNTYTVHTTTRMTPAPEGMPAVESNVTAHYAGPCPAGMTPGDRSFNGHVMHGPG